MRATRTRSLRSITKEIMVVLRPSYYTDFGFGNDGFTALSEGLAFREYCLLTALVALVALPFILHASAGMQALWTGANTSLTAGNAAVSSTPAAADASASTPAH